MKFDGYIDGKSFDDVDEFRNELKNKSPKNIAIKVALDGCCPTSHSCTCKELKDLKDEREALLTYMTEKKEKVKNILKLVNDAINETETLERSIKEDSERIRKIEEKMSELEKYEKEDECQCEMDKKEEDVFDLLTNFFRW